jgi:hypothetical protein
MDGIMNHADPFTHAEPIKTLDQLRAGERLFVWGFRAMAQYRRLGWPTIADLRQAYGHYGVGDAVPSLDALLEAFACTAHTAIELHCPGCRHVSPGEYHLLQAISAAQSGSLDLARQEFERWLPGVAADWVLGPACGLGRIFQAAGLTLPQREAEPLKLHETMAMQSWPVGSPTVH